MPSAYLLVFKKILTVNARMVMVNYKKYEMIQSQTEEHFPALGGKSY